MRGFWFAVIGLLIAVSGAGCADIGSTSDKDQRGVFYGGATAGGARL